MVPCQRIPARAAIGLGLGLGLGVASPARAEEPAPGSIERSWFPLRPGDTGALVSRLQSRLAWLGHGIDPGERASATMGPSTIDALHAFEDKFGLVRTNDLPKRQWDAIARLAPSARTASRSSGHSTLPSAATRSPIPKIRSDSTSGRRSASGSEPTLRSEVAGDDVPVAAERGRE